MTKNEFITYVAKIAVKDWNKRHIMLPSVVIAQACKESSFGTSELATNANAIFGIKLNGWTGESYRKKADEQNADGTFRTDTECLWRKYKDWEESIVDHTTYVAERKVGGQTTPNYKSIVGETNVKKVIAGLVGNANRQATAARCTDTELKKYVLEGTTVYGYHTGLNYSQSLLDDYIIKYNLTKYDPSPSNDTSKKEGENKVMSNSSLVTYTNLSPNKTSPRTHKIDTITIHCIVGQWTAKQGCDYFAKSTAQASANYVVGKDGSIGLCVEEKDRSWCSSNASNDHRAITIEVASDTTSPYAVTDKALSTLIKLCADICKRNGIDKLVWSTNKNDRVNHLNGCNMTVHRDFKNKACPGDYLYERHGYIADEVNKLLGTSSSTTISTTANLYRVRKSWEDSASQKGAYTSLDNAKKNCPSGYSVFDKDGKCVYSNAPVVDTKKYYRVQTGSYAIEKNAIALQTKLKKDGFNSIIKKEGLLHKVQVGAYSQKSNAEAMLKNLKAKGYSAFIVYA